MMEWLSEYINEDNIAAWQTTGIEYGVNILFAVAIFVVGRFIARRIKLLLQASLRKGKADEALVGFLGDIAYSLMLTFVIIAALSKLGIETTSLAAILAAAGLAVGLALQGSLSNFASGVMIIIFKPFKVGDFVEIGGESGVVKAIAIFTSTLTTPDNKVVIIPNAQITDSSITNYSAEKTRRVDLVFGCGYDDDLKLARKTLEQVVKAEKRILTTKDTQIAVSELADSSVNFVVRPWVKTADYWDVYFALTENVKLAFDKAGLSIPYPQQDVHMHAVEAEKPKKAAPTKKAAPKKK